MRVETRGRKELFGGDRRVWHAYYEMQRECGRIVNRWIAQGYLPRARLFACVDCGKPAYGYDHRDYTKPLAIEPVCRSHNALRGVAEPFRGFLSSRASSASPTPNS
jgi:hypothetical protein